MAQARGLSLARLSKAQSRAVGYVYDKHRSQKRARIRYTLITSTVVARHVVVIHAAVLRAVYSTDVLFPPRESTKPLEAKYRRGPVISAEA